MFNEHLIDLISSSLSGYLPKPGFSLRNVVLRFQLTVHFNFA